jgi:hypothetical protein
MTGLKILVICMGLLIVIGIGLVGYGVTRNHHPGVALPAQTASPPQAGFFASDLPLPRGAKLTSVTATNDRIVLHFTGGEAADRILLLDAHSGQVTGSVTLVPESH